MNTAFSLLELMVVIALMALVAGAGINLVGTMDAHARNAETLATVEALHRATMGPSPVVPGYIGTAFLQDVGRLPQDLSELRQPGPLPAYGIDPVWRLGAGWRGPYLAQDRAGLLEGGSGDGAPRDGWGRELTRSALSSALEVYAPDDPARQHLPVVAAGAWQVDIGPWQILLRNGGGTTLSVALRLLVPVWDGGPPFEQSLREQPGHWSPIDYSVPAGSEILVSFGDDGAGGLAPRPMPVGLRRLVALDPTRPDSPLDGISVTIDPWQQPAAGTLVLAGTAPAAPWRRRRLRRRGGRAALR